MLVTSITEAIGNTPMIEFTAKDYPMPSHSKIYGKLEYMNPGGSIKDRLGIFLLIRAQEKNYINSETTIIEPTAGNTGIGLALAARQLNLKTIFVVPEKFSLEKQIIMQALGAKIMHSPTSDGIKGAIKKAKELNRLIPNSYVPLQFENTDNPLAYYETIAPEIYNDLNKSELTSFVAGIGSGGTFVGIAQYLLEKNAHIRLIGVEPEGSILNGGISHNHRIEGIGVEFIPPFLKTIPVTEVQTISDLEGFDYTKKLALNHGILAGSSSGAAMAAALKEIRKLPDGSTVLTIFPDGSDRYLSQNIYEIEKS